jgi:hypothetical protein
MIWQVRCGAARRVMQRSGRFGWGLAGAVRQVTSCSDGFGRGTLGFGRFGGFGSGGLRWVKAVCGLFC